MPYAPHHKIETRARIIEAARVLFNQRGFTTVTIDDVMGAAGLTRGGFYNHFKNKEELYREAVASFLSGRGKTWRDDAGVDPENGGPETVRAMVNAYLSDEHFDDVDGQCPMIALPSDVARSTTETRESYESLLRAMMWLYENNLSADTPDKRNVATILSTLSVGGMVLSRTLNDEQLANDVRATARHFALSMVKDA